MRERESIQSVNKRSHQSDLIDEYFYYTKASDHRSGLPKRQIKVEKVIKDFINLEKQTILPNGQILSFSFRFEKIFESFELSSQFFSTSLIAKESCYTCKMVNEQKSKDYPFEFVCLLSTFHNKCALCIYLSKSDGECCAKFPDENVIEKELLNKTHSDSNHFLQTANHKRQVSNTRDNTSLEHPSPIKKVKFSLNDMQILSSKVEAEKGKMLNLPHPNEDTNEIPSSTSDMSLIKCQSLEEGFVAKSSSNDSKQNVESVESMIDVCGNDTEMIEATKNPLFSEKLAKREHSVKLLEEEDDEKDLKSWKYHSDSLRKIYIEKEQSNNQLKKENDQLKKDLKEEKVKHNQLLIQASKEHKNEIENLHLQHQKEMDGLKLQYSNEIKRQQDKHEGEKQEIQKELKRKLHNQQNLLKSKENTFKGNEEYVLRVLNEEQMENVILKRELEEKDVKHSKKMEEIRKMTYD